MVSKRSLKRKRAKARKQKLRLQQNIFNLKFANQNKSSQNSSYKKETGEIDQNGQNQNQQNQTNNQNTQNQQNDQNQQNNEEIEYIVKLPEENPNFEQFREIFAKFATPTPSDKDDDLINQNFPFLPSDKNVKNIKNNQNFDQKIDKIDKNDNKNGQKINFPDHDLNLDSDSDEAPKTRLSNKKRKLRDRLSVAQLKQIVERPDLVELHDPNSPDPTLLVHLKTTRNTVAVPGHWLDKRRYLSSKRGFEKASFVLPKAIQETGVSELRNSGKLKTLKQKQRQRMNPKIGRLDIDYQRLHAAFFRYMKKPKMTSHGDIYYAEKEKEVRYRRHRPGTLSKRLKNALHMMENSPPPYLINMQRFGLPPSYPELKIPGLNSPIPPGCKYGYGENQWGKPPVDENGYPLYGDPFGIHSSYTGEEQMAEKRPRWGEIEENIADENDFDEANEDEENSESDDSAIKKAVDEAMKENGHGEKSFKGEKNLFDEENGEKNLEGEKNGVKKIFDGVETPDDLKREQKKLFEILDQKEAKISENSAMGSSHSYNVPKNINSDSNK